MEHPTLHVAIIGAGLSGLATVLALHQRGIDFSVYEARDKPLDIGGGLMLAPNGLRVLDKLGVYSSLSKRGFSFDNVYMQNGVDNRIIESIQCGNLEHYGFRALYIYRYKSFYQKYEKNKFRFLLDVNSLI